MGAGALSGGVPKADRWPVQVEGSFGFTEQLGFRVLGRGTYRLGNWTLLGNGDTGIKLDCDGDTRSLEVTLVRLKNDQMLPRWWEPHVPRARLKLRAVAELIAPESLADEASLPLINSEADRAPHLRFWASVLQAAATEWLHGDRTWLARVERQLRGEHGE